MPDTRTPERRQLRRSGADQKIGGVCAGLADYFGVDPMLVRIAAVALAFVTGGTVVWVYLAAWWLLPEAPRTAADATDTRHRHGHGPFPWCPPWKSGRGGHNHPDLSTIIGFALLGVAGLMVFHHLPFWDDDLMLALGLLAVGFGILWFGKQGKAAVEDEQWLAGDDAGDDAGVAGTVTAPVAGPVSATESVEPEADGVADESPFEPVTPWYEIPIDRPAPPAPLPPAPLRRRRPGRWIAPTVFGLLFMGAGVVGLLVAAGVDVSAGQAFAAGLVIVGSGMMVAAFAGRGRGMIFPGVVLLALLSFGSVVKLPLTAGIGERDYESIGDGEFELGIGEMTIDLSGVDPDELRGETIEVRQGIGELTVLLPRDVGVDGKANVALGNIAVNGDDDGGVRPEHEFDGEPTEPDGPVVTLDLELGMGEIVVEYPPMNERRFDPLALIAGLFFTVIGIVALAVGTDAIADAMWVWPVLFCVLGAGFLASAALRAGRSEDDPAGDLDLD